ncbi:hypothetical protein [Dictyobacter arantiisoli]|uniref:Glycosyltransferase RgtA/B/C/D-like domain-containing protein n=1 Tax=Dictyobacter arantiisoli TaxID=2014874 RepID=A0A5A5TBR9_9CHLR|nr:hypothetical protein [Dictyobacter arantiisoli]GCF08940.1 hypothetical protein KDI_25040 [Dictyobacter arantiisoli]
MVNLIQTSGHLVNFWRLPVYPLFITAIYAMAGQGNVEAVSIGQAVLFVCATLEIYWVAALIFKRPWIAFVLGLTVGGNLMLLSYVKPLMTEGMGLWLLTSLVLLTLLFLRTFKRRFLWLTALVMFLLFMTRPEWLYLPPIIFAYILFIAFTRKNFRRTLLHVIASGILIYAIVVGYIFVNTTQNHFMGTTWIQNINEVGKVIQYRMQTESSSTNPRDVAISQDLNSEIKAGNLDPYSIMERHPDDFKNYASETGSFSQAIIIRHPLEYIQKSIPIILSIPALGGRESSYDSAGPFAGFLQPLTNAGKIFHSFNVCFFLIVILWICLFCIKRSRKQQITPGMILLLLICNYGLIITVVGGYRYMDYVRTDIQFNPLMFIIIWGTLLLVIDIFITKNSRGAFFNGIKNCTRIISSYRIKGKKLVRTSALLSMLLMLCLSGCGIQSQISTTHSVLKLSCHQEGGVGLLFINISNAGIDQPPAILKVTFTAQDGTTIHLQTSTPTIPATQERLLTVNVPQFHTSVVKNPFMIDYKMPAGTIHLQLAAPTSAATSSNMQYTC